MTAGRLAGRRRARAGRVPERPGDRQRRRRRASRSSTRSFVLLLNAHHEDIVFSLPPRRFGPRWQVELSTAYPRRACDAAHRARGRARDCALDAAAARARRPRRLECGPVPSRLNCGGGAHGKDRRTRRNARHEGPRVRVPARSAPRRASHASSSTRASWARRWRARRQPRGGRRGGRCGRRGAARRRRPRAAVRRWPGARPTSSPACTPRAAATASAPGGSGNTSIAAEAMRRCRSACPS